jgi:hypothetical protein
MKNFRNQIVINYIIPLILLLGVSSVIFYRSAEISTAHKDNLYTFSSMSKGLETYYDFKTAWKPRLFSNALAAATMKVGNSILHRTNLSFIESPLELAVALWTSAWFFLTCLLFIFVARKNSVFYILGIFAALSFGYMPRLATRIYPWDMPAMFVFSVFLILFIRSKMKWLFVLLPLAMGFKETVLLLPLAFLFTDEPWKKRLTNAAIAAGLCVLVKVAIDIFVHSPLPFLTMETGGGDSIGLSYFPINLTNLLAVHPLLINAGTLLAFLLLPIFDKKMLSLKLIAALFILGNFVFGVIFEYRIWFEMIPFALYGLEIASYGFSSLAGSNSMADGNPRSVLGEAQTN